MSKMPFESQILPQAGQNLTRVVIASYFIAVALGLIGGTSATPMFNWALDTGTASIVAKIWVFVLSFLVLTGLFLRPAALLLAITVFWSSLMTNLTDSTPTGVSEFWRDLALIGALVLTYTMTGSRAARRRAMVRFAPKVRKVKVKDPVTPRRVVQPAPQDCADVEPADAPSNVKPFRKADAPSDENPRENIFADTYSKAVND